LGISVCVSDFYNGFFEWTSPLGRIYRTQAEPLNPPKTPAPPRTAPTNDLDPPPF
jgi:hypothetical protein